MCIKKWGSSSQIIKCISELNELGAVLCDYLLYGDKRDWKGENKNLKSKIENEIADVLITLNSLLLIFDEEQVSKFVTFKLLRLLDRLKEGDDVTPEEWWEIKKKLMSKK